MNRVNPSFVFVLYGTLFSLVDCLKRRISSWLHALSWIIAAWRVALSACQAVPLNFWVLRGLLTAFFLSPFVLLAKLKYVGGADVKFLTVGMLVLAFDPRVNDMVSFLMKFQIWSAFLFICLATAHYACVVLRLATLNLKVIRKGSSEYHGLKIVPLIPFFFLAFLLAI
ncbi:MAG: hypothetical protein Kow0069_02050 [Promethearchaeota archaeon]